MQEETEELKRQIDILEIAIQKEQERARVLERKYATISGGGGEESEETEADRAERAVEKRVTEIYQVKTRQISISNPFKSQMKLNDAPGLQDMNGRSVVTSKTSMK